MNLRQLITMASRLNFGARAVRLEPESLEHLRLPAMLHWELNHFVVISRVGRRGGYILDPASGARWMTRRDISEKFTGVGIEFIPTAVFATRKKTARFGLFDMWQRSRGLASAMTTTLALSILLQACLLLTPLIMQIIVDTIVPWRDFSLLWLTVCCFAAIGLGSVLVETLRSHYLLELGQRLNSQMGLNLVTHLLKLPVSYFHERDAGQIISRVSSTFQIRQTVTDDLMSSAVDMFVIAIALAVLVAYNIWFAAIALGAVAFYAAVRALSFQTLKGLSEEVVVAESRETTQFLESIVNIDAIKLFSAQDMRRAVWQNDNAKLMNATHRLESAKIAIRSLSKALVASENIAIIFLCALAAMHQTMTLGMVFSFLLYHQYFRDRSFEIVDRVSQLGTLSLHVDRIADIALTAPEQLHSVRAAPVPIGSIEIRDMTFAYSNTDKDVLRNINLEIAAGEFVAIVGPSGAGKSTLAKVLLGLHQPKAGDVLINGEPILGFGLDRYRSRVGIVAQEAKLFSGSLAENISFFDPTTDQDRVQQCARYANIHDEIVEMPMKYDSVVGDVGNILSVGQKQRVLLARALYRNPDLLVLDEGTANLDSENETKIADFIESLSITRVVIAHRPELVRRAHVVYELRDGELRRLGARTGTNEGRHSGQLADAS